MPSVPGLAGVPDIQRREAVKGLPGRDFSGILATAATASPQAVRARRPVQLHRSLHD